MAAAVKAAAVAALVRVLYVAFGPALASVGDLEHTGWLSALSVIAYLYLTMLGGNVLALAQKSVKRMLAYSSISHAGYLLVAVAAGAHADARQGATQAALFYLASYAATALGAFAVCAALERRDGPAVDDDTRYDGLAQRHPWMALCMAIFMLSLGGIPPTAGFMGKLFIFRSAMDANLTGLAVVGVLSSVAGLWYYLRVIVLMYMKPSPASASVAPRTFAMGVGLALTAGVTLLFGIGPELLSGLASAVTLGQ
jgi:NADH-quinone oxidoreductase subunit N